MSGISQTDATLMLLYSRPDGITAMDALDSFGCFRLAARIVELRARGHNIQAVPVTVGHKRIVRYKLIRPPAGSWAPGELMEAYGK
jgi:hypothetical protein